MGLWIKNADGTIERTAGGGADGADGADGQPGADGNMWHVGSGAPASTLGEPGDYYLDGTDGWVHVKRTNSSWTNLFVNLTGPPGSGGDFLPLEGGTLTGGLIVGGRLEVANAAIRGYDGNETWPAFTFQSDTNTGLYRIGADVLGFSCGSVKVASIDKALGGRFFGPGHATGSAVIGVPDDVYPAYRFYGDENTGMYRKGADQIGFAANGALQLAVYDYKVHALKDLQVDGHVTTGAGKAVYFGGNWDGAKIFNVSSGVRKYMTIGDQANGGSQIVLYGNNEADGGTDDGKMYIRSGGEPTVKLAADQSVHFYGDVTSAGTINARIAFGVADGIDTQGVLERAETATMPVIDEEGVATADAEGVMLNDVVAALLLKVKELSARIETLEAKPSAFG